MKRALAVALAAALAGGALAARAAVPAATAPAPPPSPVGEDGPTCTDTFPQGAARPKVTETFPDKARTGWALPLEITIEHGKGETVLSGSGLGAHSDADAALALARQDFYLPNPKGDAAPKLETTVVGDRAKSRLTIRVVALPRKPGRKELVLPPLPVAIARASGEVRTFCTSPHHVTVEDPTANTPDAKPKGNPRPLRQIEEWTAAKHAAIGAALALAAGALLAWLWSLWRRRPKPAVPPPPPRPPWDVALEELFDVRRAKLVEQGRFAEHFDRVSDAVRRYLGARYGFDGLETTTREAMSALRKVSPRIPVLEDVGGFLDNADLVKFAKLTPDEPECEAALGRAEEIVRRTMPAPEVSRPVESAERPPGPSTGGGAPS